MPGSSGSSSSSNGGGGVSIKSILDSSDRSVMHIGQKYWELV
jgi:hypothetical protein